MDKKHNLEINLDREILSRIEKIEDDISSCKVEMIEQEHRLLSVLSNLYHTYSSGDRTEKVASIKALIYYLLPGGRTVIIVSGGVLIGLLTLILMQKNNELVAASNYHLQEQIYVQSNSDRLSKVAKITEYLYEKKRGISQDSIDSIRGVGEIWQIGQGWHSPEPLYNEFTRSVAFDQLVKITGFAFNRS